MRSPSWITIILLCGSTFVPAQNGAEVTLYSFTGNGNGGVPAGNPVQAEDGNFYGVTTAGGVNSGEGGGTIYRLTSAGTLTTLFTFCEGSACTDGFNQPSGLIAGGDGSLYGVTRFGGNLDDCTDLGFAGNYGCGTLFSVSTAGAYRLVHAFTNSADGYGPVASLVQGNDGNLYGATPAGGTNNGGVAFKVTPQGDFTVLYSFCALSNCSDGSSPNGLVQASDGNFYGTTQFGGSGDSGTIFKLSATGKLTTLYSFEQATSGAYPNSALVQGPDSNLYGSNTTYSSEQDGFIFSFSLSGGGLQLWGPEQGFGQPSGALFLASNSEVYATTQASVFQINPSNGNTNTLYEVDDFEDGTDLSGVSQGDDGKLYLSAESAGQSDSGCFGMGCGTIFDLTPSTPPSAPVQVSLSASQVQPGASVTASLKVLNAFSLTMQQCYAVQSLNGAVTPLGKVPGAYNSSTSLYTFSGTIPAPSKTGIYTYAVTCGGVESGFATLTVGDTTTTTLAATPNPVTPPASVTLTATVKRTTGAGTPTGRVTFSSGTVVLGSAGLNGAGVATLAASSKGVPAGMYPVTATYSGDTEDVSSTSEAVNVVVQ